DRLAQARDRLLGPTGVRRHDDQGVRPAVLGKQRASMNVHGNAETLPEQGADELAGDGRASHPAACDRRDAVRRWKTLGSRADRIADPEVLPRSRDNPEHAAGIAGGDGAFVVEVDHFVPAGFSASSISITGMSSRTGYR